MCLKITQTPKLSDRESRNIYRPNTAAGAGSGKEVTGTKWQVEKLKYETHMTHIPPRTPTMCCIQEQLGNLHICESKSKKLGIFRKTPIFLLVHVVNITQSQFISALTSEKAHTSKT